jgi:hypothetical protein
VEEGLGAVWAAPLSYGHPPVVPCDETTLSWWIQRGSSLGSLRGSLGREMRREWGRKEGGTKDTQKRP